MPHFLYSLVDGHLGCFHLVSIINNVAINKFLSGHIFSFLLVIDLGMELMSHVVSLCLTI